MLFQIYIVNLLFEKQKNKKRITDESCNIRRRKLGNGNS